MRFKKDDMCCAHYNWNDGSAKKGMTYNGEPSRRLFNRFNGDQVLFLINFYFSLYPEGYNLRQARIAEWEIKHHLPADIKSELSVFNWLHSSAMKVN